MKKPVKKGQKDDKKMQTASILFVGMLLSLALQIFKFHIFPIHYFNDADIIQQLMRISSQLKIGDAYGLSAFVFQGINKILPMDNQLLGGMTIWAVCILPCGWIAARFIRPVWEHYILFAMYCVLLPVFVWNTHKETLQFLFFLVLLVVVLYGEERTCTADILIVVLTFLWGILFRSYYMIVAFGIAVFAFLFQKNISEKVRRNICCILIVLGVTILCIIKIVRPAMLETLFNSRTIVNMDRVNSEQAKTMFLNILDNTNGSVFLYLVNYAISAVRLLFPVELLFKGVQYIPYFIGQIFWTTALAAAVKKAIRKEQPTNRTQKRLLTIAISWYLVTFLYEPDFGSYIRHQTALYPVIFPLLLE